MLRASLRPLYKYTNARMNVINTVKQTMSSSSEGQRYTISETAASKMKRGDKAEVSVGQHKVLLVKNYNDEITAISPKCTHYGAPMKNGVVTKDGRITCPWHGACFSTTTGDIEDAPALDALHAFKVDVDNDTIYVTAAEQDLKAGSRNPCKKIQAVQSKSKGTVIIGGGAAGLACAEGLRQSGYNDSITILTKEPNLPLDRTKLSKAYITDANKILLRTQEQIDDWKITVKQTGASKVDKKNKSVKLEDGSEISYDKLVLAVGAAPTDLPIDGFKLDGVFKLRDITHTQAITKALGEDKSKHLLILGGSFIGTESAMGLLPKAASVTIIEPAYPMQKVLGDDISKRLVKLHEEKGVKFIIGEGSVKKILPSDSDSSKIGSALLENGNTIPCDVLVAAVGVKPATQFLKDDFDLQKDGGLEVEQDCKVKGEQDIYAIGDIASFVHPGTDTSGRIEHWNVAQNLGRAAALSIVGQPSEYNKVPYFWSAQQGKQLRYSGHATDYDDVIIQGSLDDLKFSGFFAKGEKILAVATIQADPVASHVSELLRLGKMPTASELRNGKNVLEITV